MSHIKLKKLFNAGYKIQKNFGISTNLNSKVIDGANTIFSHYQFQITLLSTRSTLSTLNTLSTLSTSLLLGSLIKIN